MTTTQRMAARAPITLLIADLASLERWQGTLRRTLWSRELPVVQFDLPQFSAAQNHSYSTLAQELRRTCGCAASGMLMSAAVVFVAVDYFIYTNSPVPSLPQALAWIGLILAAGAAGKLAALAWARWRLIGLAGSTRVALGTQLFASR
jgi:hypothetical protein